MTLQRSSVSHADRTPVADRTVQLASWTVLIAGLFFLPGCVRPDHAGPGGLDGATVGRISKEDLRAALNMFEDAFDATLSQATADLEEKSTDPRTRRNTLLWRVRMMPACHSAMRQEDSIRAFLDVWTLCIRMRHFLEDGEGRTLFGDGQPIAITAAKQIEADIERVGRLFLPEDKLAKAREEGEAFAKAHPMRGMFVGAIVRTGTTEAGAPSRLASIVDVPLAPFRAMEGIDNTAAAIRSFTSVADRFSDIVEEFPESARWQMELMVLDLEQDRAIQSGLASFEKISDSSARLSTTAEKLPDELSQRLSSLLDEVDAKQANVQATLDRADQTAATVDRALQTVDTAANSIDRTALSVADAGRAWGATARTIGETVRDIQGPPAPASSEPAGQAAAPAPATQPAGASSGESGDALKDYRDTAQTLTETATELRLLAMDIRGLIDSPGLRTTVDQTAAQARGVTDHLTWRSIELVLLVFVLVVAYRVTITVWLGRRNRTSPQSND